MESTITLDDYRGTQIEKSFQDPLEKSREGLIPIRKPVTRKGKTFTQTFWVKPKDAASFKATGDAAQFLLQSAEAYRYFSEITKKLAGYNDNLAKEVYASMEASGKKIIELGDQTLKIAQWTGTQQSNVGDFLAALKKKEEGGKRLFNWSDIEKTFGDIVYRLKHSGLMIEGQDEKALSKFAAISEVTPENWGGKIKSIVGVMKKKMTDSLGRVTDILKKRKDMPKGIPIKDDLEEKLKASLKKEIAERPRKKVQEKKIIVFKKKGTIKKRGKK